MTTNQKPTSPLLGWVAAGADLVSDQLDQVTGMVSKQLDATHALFEELQQRGEPVDEQIRHTLSPTSVFSSIQTLVMANPLFSLFSGNKKASVREQQLAALSVKIDLLVEQVALLAASKAKAQADAQASSTPARQSASKTATKPTQAKAAATGSTSKPAASASSKGSSSSKTASKPASRKRSTTPAKRSSATTSKTTSSATKKAD